MAESLREKPIERRETSMSAQIQAKTANPIQRKVTAGVAVGALGTIAVWVIEVSTGVPVPSYVALAIDTVLVALVQYAVPNQSG